MGFDIETDLVVGTFRILPGGTASQTLDCFGIYDVSDVPTRIINLFDRLKSKFRQQQHTLAIVRKIWSRLSGFHQTTTRAKLFSGTFSFRYISLTHLLI